MSYERINSAPPPKLEEFPPIEDTEATTAEVNRLFTPYVFFEKHKDSIELSCSCCRQHGYIDKLPRTLTPEISEILWGKHNEQVTCPYCGTRATYKNARKLGKKTNLAEYKPVAMLFERDGDIYVRAYWTRKRYDALLEAPAFYLVGAYHFSPGRATYYFDIEDRRIKTRSESGRLNPAAKQVSEPFTQGSWYWWSYVPYTVLGMEAIEKSSFKYCCYEQFEPGVPALWGTEHIQTHWALMRFLAACCIYPRQIEMLLKTGNRRLVEDLVTGRRKNKAIFDWDKPTITEAFGLSKQELRQWRESGTELETIAWYKKLCRAGVGESFKMLGRLDSPTTNEEFIRLCCKLKIKPTKLSDYISKQHINRADFDPDLPWRLHETWQSYKDYTEMATMLGWDLKDETVLLPKDLHRKHDEATEEINLKTLNEGLKLISVDIRRRSLKYNFELGDYFIRCAVCAEEIVNEGKTLKHCVGGYAQRHMNGALTILFLRKKSAPGKSLYTVEMNGNSLKQIHGYKNDYGARKPIETMAWFLDPWLEWVKKGSKRDKEGRPKLPKTKGVKTA